MTFGFGGPGPLTRGKYPGLSLRILGHHEYLQDAARISKIGSTIREVFVKKRKNVKGVKVKPEVRVAK